MWGNLGIIKKGYSNYLANLIPFYFCGHKEEKHILLNKTDYTWLQKLKTLWLGIWDIYRSNAISIITIAVQLWVYLWVVSSGSSNGIGQKISLNNDSSLDNGLRKRFLAQDYLTYSSELMIPVNHSVSNKLDTLWIYSVWSSVKQRLYWHNHHLLISHR